MKIIVAGATGFIGKLLVNRIQTEGHEVYCVGRDKEKIRKTFGGKVKEIQWNINLPVNQNKELVECLPEIDVVINLAGENISAKRWTKAFKQQIIDSRIKSTKLLVDAIKLNKHKPGIFITSSAIGYYGILNKDEITETSPPGDDFMSKVCVEWEKASFELESLGIRRVIIRTGIVLSKTEGALKKMLLPFKMFFGGPLGSGKQYFPWIHESDLIDIFIYAVNNDLRGAINGVAPEIVDMNQFSRQLGKQLHRPSFFRVPKIILKIILGEAAEYFTEGLKIKPARLSKAGFKFKFGELKNALGSLL